METAQQGTSIATYPGDTVWEIGDTEMQAILQGLQSARQSLQETNHLNTSLSIVIFTDSQSCLKLLEKAYSGSRNSMASIYKITGEIERLLNQNEERKITLRWIKAHADHSGNESADKVTKGGLHLQPIAAQMPLEIIKRLVKQQCRKSWKETWKNGKSC